MLKAVLNHSSSVAQALFVQAAHRLVQAKHTGVQAIVHFGQSLSSMVSHVHAGHAVRHGAARFRDHHQRARPVCPLPSPCDQDHRTLRHVSAAGKCEANLTDNHCAPHRSVIL